MKRRTLILALGSTSAVSLTIGSGAFNSMIAERGVRIDVVPDDQALVGYDTSESIKSNPEKTLPKLVITDENEQQTLATITNRFDGETYIKIKSVEVTTQCDEPPDIVEINWNKNPFGPGESANIRGKIVCNGEEGQDTVELTVTVEGQGEDVAARLHGDTDTRQFLIRCESE